MNRIPAFLLKAHVVLSTLWTILSSLSYTILVEAKHISTADSDSVHVRTKRNSFQFANMVSCVTDRNSFDFMDYGCYCGLGGMGEPKDDLDWCCYDHDNCWSEVLKNPECTGLSGPYTITYDWGCSATSNAYCYDAENTCDRKTCDCDRKAAECFARSEYHPAYYDLDPFDNCNTTFVDRREEEKQESVKENQGNAASTSLPVTPRNGVLVAFASVLMRSWIFKNQPV